MEAVISYNKLFVILIAIVFFFNSKAYGQDVKNIKIGDESFYIYPYYYIKGPIFEKDPNLAFIFPDTLQDGKWIQYYEDSTSISQIGEYKNHVKDGEFIFFDKDGNKERLEAYKKGSLVKRSLFYKDNTVKSEVYYSNGIAIEEKEWYENGSIKHIANKGKQIFWYPNGNKKIEKNYINNVLEGLVTSWYEDGQVEYKGYWSNGVPEEKCFYAKRNKSLKENKCKNLPKELQYKISYKIYL